MLVKEVGYRSEVNKCILKQGSMVNRDAAVWWEGFKRDIKKMSIKYSGERRKKERMRERKVRGELEKEEGRINMMTGRGLGEYVRLKEELGEIEREKCMGAIIRSRAKYLVEGEKCTGFFLGMEKRKQGKSYIARIEGKGGEMITDLVGIAKRVEEFYGDLFKEERIDRESLEVTIDSMGRSLSEEGRELCEGGIGEREIEQAIKGLARNKSPGLDGLTAEFYVEFWEVLVPLLHVLFEQLGGREELPADMSTGVISILFKKGCREKLENYRPLSMLNTDYKMLARVLSNRIKRVIGTVVGGTQAYSIPGRDISDTVSSIRDVFGHMKKEVGGVVVSLDLNKAFDRVNHTYLFRVLEKAGFGKGLVGWIRRIYAGAMSCVKVNGVITNVFKLGRSVRQGCPLSAMLYALSAEPLAALLMKNKDIRGVEVPGGGESLVFQYADDTTITVRNMESIKGIFESLKVYGGASGAKVNIEKSEYMVLGGRKEGGGDRAEGE